MVPGSCSCPESDRMGYLKQNGPRSVEVAEFSSRGHVGIVQYSAGVAAYKCVLMHISHSQRCKCALAS